MTMKKLCIYHKNCLDGFGAAWVVRKAFGDNVEFHPGVYQEPPPDVTGRDVILVDFSYKWEVVCEMRKKASSMTIIDHHITAIKDLCRVVDDQSGLCEIKMLLNKSCSGAYLAWAFYFTHDPVPRLIRHIQDRDLWEWKLDGTREITAALASYPYDFNLWDNFMTDDGCTRLCAEGAPITRQHMKNVYEAIESGRRKLIIDGIIVPAVNASLFLASDIGNILAAEAAFAAVYCDTPQGRSFSLRSTDQGRDVSEIAKKYGGGGHRNAAGFKVSLAESATFELVE